MFLFDFLFVIVTMVVGLAALVWIRFISFPPFLPAYEQQLAQARYFSRKKYSRPETTIRSKSSRRRRRR